MLTDFDGNPLPLKIQRIQWDPIQAEKGGYKHFMLKEINEQPRAIRDTTLGRVSLDTGQVFLERDGDWRRGISRGHAHRHCRLRHELACGAGREIHDRAAGAAAGGGGLCERVPLSRSRSSIRTRSGC